MTAFVRRTCLPLMIALIAGTGCVRAIYGRPGPGPDDPFSGTGRLDAEADRPAFSQKRVARKSPISTLIAEDGSRCAVTEQRFRSTEIGDEVWCVWEMGES